MSTEQSRQDEIEELKKQLEAAKAENQRLEMEVKYEDKLTGLWNRKYAEKTLAEEDLDQGNEGFTIVCTDLDNLSAVTEKSGAEAGDALIKDVADGLKKSFGAGATCCKLAGTKMCVILNTEKEDLENKLKEFENFIASVKAANNDIDISYGVARHDGHPEKDANALLNEAEYELQMHKVSKQSDDKTAAVPRKTRGQGDSITILMIDDSLIILRTLQMMLKDKYKVLMTTSGMEGYEIARNKQPDLILLDYNMPVVDGERIMHLLKESNQTKNIPVIFISGVSDKEKILKVASLKPAGYLLKPVQKENLLNTISSVMDSEAI